MVGHLRSSGRALTRAATPFLLCVGLSVGTFGLTQAAQPGHGRVNSLAGAPLEVSVPVTGLTADDLKVLKATIADPSAWTQAGLTLPAAIDSMSIAVEPGLSPSSRMIVLRSTQAVDRPVIDVLISLTTASGTKTIQSSYLVLTSDRGAGAVQVSRGDTLYSIALSRTVPGADIYQVMWAIYEANPQAFISANMNLLRAGSTLQIPDAMTIRRVDPKYAREMFAKHDGAFRARRGTGVAPIARAQTVAAIPAESGKVTAAVEAPKQAPAVDQVRLSSSNPADQQSDARVATANALNEMQSRVEELQKNIEELRETLRKSQAISGQTLVSGATGAAGAPGAAGVPGAAGASGATGTAGVAGVAGSPGKSSAADAAGAAGLTGTSPGAVSAAGAVGAAGTSGSAGSVSATASTSGSTSDSTAGGTSGGTSGSKVAGASSAANAAAGASGVAGGAAGVSATPNGMPDNKVGRENSTQSTDAAAANRVKNTFTQVKDYASDHVLGFVLGISGLLALLIALLLRRAGRQEQKESSDDAPRPNPALESAFDQKLQSIDLNLDSDDSTVAGKTNAPQTKV
ncbi:FimV/HubP family polar landmark protein [Zwartia sp.]|uniref:type IV pilus assembly protein FimV n=1 Tax=Zwartia sp. TaxID=2978004 RepID=UPI002727D77E|nr:FimV/HubP family polar landmark protein [Zwartia sp.]MDO9024852.1 FimV/HubP family polar landmark protein [Zwartia sp.]